MKQFLGKMSEPTGRAIGGSIIRAIDEVIEGAISEGIDGSSGGFIDEQSA